MITDSYKLIFRFLKSENQSLRSLFVFSIAGNVLLLSIPFIIQQLVEQYSILVFQQATVFLILLAMIFLGGITVMRIFQMHLSERLQRRLFLKGAERVKKNILNQNVKGHQLSLSKINYFFESVNLQKSLIPLIIDGSTLAVQSAIVFILISFYHPLFFLYSALIGGGLYFVLVVMGKKTELLSYEESAKKYAVLSSLQSLANVENYTQISESTKLSNALLDYFETREARYKLFFRQSVGILLIKVTATIALLSLGGLLVVNNKMTIGQLVASELIITNLLISLFKFTYLLDYWYDSLVGLKKLETELPVDGEKQ